MARRLVESGATTIEEVLSVTPTDEFTQRTPGSASTGILLMAAFAYKALQSNGSLVEGTIEAGGRHQAMQQIEGRGLKPVRLTEQQVHVAASQKRQPRTCRRCRAVSGLESRRGRVASRPGCWRTSRVCFPVCSPPACRSVAPWSSCIARRSHPRRKPSGRKSTIWWSTACRSPRPWPARRKRSRVSMSPWSKPGRPVASSMSCSPRSRTFKRGRRS
jgi:hypothetical protein